MTLAGNGLASLLPSFDVRRRPTRSRTRPGLCRARRRSRRYLHQEALAKGIYAIPRGCFENGMHQITSTSKPVRTAPICGA
jgi:hypothetical protein